MKKGLFLSIFLGCHQNGRSLLTPEVVQAGEHDQERRHRQGRRLLLLRRRPPEGLPARHRQQGGGPGSRRAEREAEGPSQKVGAESSEPGDVLRQFFS